MTTPDPLAGAAQGAAAGTISNALARGWPPTPGVQRILLTAPGTIVRKNPGDTEPVLETVDADTEADCHNGVRTPQGEWHRITLANGKMGFIPGNTPMRKLPQHILVQATATLREEASESSAARRELRKGYAFLLLELSDAAEPAWLKVRGDDGLEGYLAGDVKVAARNAPHAETESPSRRSTRSETPVRRGTSQPGAKIGRRSELAPGAERSDFQAFGEGSPRQGNPAMNNIIMGGLICMAGIAITAVSYSMASPQQGGGSYVVAWGAIIFGALRVFRGFAGLR